MLHTQLQPGKCSPKVKRKEGTEVSAKAVGLQLPHRFGFSCESVLTISPRCIVGCAAEVTDSRLGEQFTRSGMRHTVTPCIALPIYSLIATNEIFVWSRKIKCKSILLLHFVILTFKLQALSVVVLAAIA